MNEFLPWTMTNISSLKLQEAIIEITSIYQYPLFSPPTTKINLYIIILKIQF